MDSMRAIFLMSGQKHIVLGKFRGTLYLKTTRSRILFRMQETIIESMELPAGLDVKSSDPEYEQVVNMWQAVSRNNTMDEV